MTQSEFFDSTVELLLATRFNPLLQAIIMLNNFNFYPQHDYSSNSQIFNLSGHYRTSYSTIDFMKDVLSELQKQPEILAKFFPERVLKYSNRDLSLLWGYNKDYISTKVYRIRSRRQSGYIFKSKSLSSLRVKIVENLGVRAIGALKIIASYEESKSNTIEFINQLKTELGRVSGTVKLTLSELSHIFGKSLNFMSTLKSSLENENKDWFKSDYKFNREILNDLKENLELESYSFKSILKLVEEYGKLNPEILYYSHQQYTITNINAFHDIFTIEAAYWFGFLCADGSVSKETSKNKYKVYFQLALKDQDRIYQFADFVGLDQNSIYKRIKFYKDSDGHIREYISLVIEFQAKPMAQKLRELGILEFKSEKGGVPTFVKEVILLAKKEAQGKCFHWSETHNGKIAHAWLLGFYDGDGHFRKYSPVVFSSIKSNLIEIKELFESPNDVLIVRNPKEIDYIIGKYSVIRGFYSLTLGPEVFKRMMKSYDKSMARKRS